MTEVRGRTENAWGVTSLGKATREAPGRRGASPYLSRVFPVASSVTTAPVIPQEAGKAITSTSTTTSTIEEFEEGGDNPSPIVLVLVLVLVFLPSFRLPPLQRSRMSTSTIEESQERGDNPSPIVLVLVLVLVLVFLPTFRLPPFKIEDEHDNEHD
jgi:hypothetical protein